MIVTQKVNKIVIWGHDALCPHRRLCKTGSKKMAKEVLVRYFNIIRGITGKSEEKIRLSDEAVLSDLLFYLVDIYGQSFDKYIFNNKGELKYIFNNKGELNSYIHIARKGQLNMVSLEQRIDNNDEYYLFVALSGG
jgi:molybdopterin converting factor small subunit